MKRSKTHKKTMPAGPKHRRGQNDKGSRIELIELDPKKGLRFQICVSIILLSLGAYLSWLYFGHEPVPNSDFTGFINAGKAILSFKLPSDFKRAPVLGMLQVSLSKLVGGNHPELTASWLLNAMIYPFSVLLFYLIAKRFIGNAAVWFAVVFSLNPWSLALLRQPLVETTFVFFILLTFYLIVRRSKWCYVLAAVTTMVRYEGAALILAAFVVDMLESKTVRQRILTVVRSALASVPLGLWVLGTLLAKKTGGTHYFQHYGQGNAMANFVKFLWTVSTGSLLTVTSAESYQMISGISKTLLVCSMIAALCYGLYKRKWDVLALVLIVVPYFFVHSMRAETLHRYCVPIAWGVLLLGIYGMQCLWKMIDRNGKVPPGVVIVLQLIVSIGFVVWVAMLMPYLPKLKNRSIVSVPVPYVAIGFVVVLFAVHIFFYRKKFVLRNIVLALTACVMIVSNQFLLVQRVGNGDHDAEFKALADWYLQNAKPGEIMVTTLPGVVGIFAPEHERYFRNTYSLKGENLAEFTQSCYEKNVSYVAWDSRIGLAPRDYYYKSWGMKKIAPLIQPKNLGPYEFIETLKRLDRRYINIFRLRRAARPGAKAGEKAG